MPGSNEPEPDGAWGADHPELGSTLPLSSGVNQPESSPRPSSLGTWFAFEPEFEPEPELAPVPAAAGGEECAPGLATATPAVSATSAPTDAPAAIARLRFMRRPRGMAGVGSGR